MRDAFFCAARIKGVFCTITIVRCVLGVVSMILATNPGYEVCTIYIHWQLLLLHVFLPYQRQ